MDEYNREKKEAAEIRKLPFEFLEFLPKRRWLVPSALIAFLFLLFVSAYFFFFYPSHHLSTFYRWKLEHDLNYYENLWESQNISKYEFFLDYGNGVYGKIVSNNSAFVNVTDSNVSPQYWLNSLNTVPKLFKIIHDAQAGRGSDYLRVSYDRNLGYPIEIFIDQYHDSFISYTPSVGQVIVDTYLYKISKFKILEQAER